MEMESECIALTLLAIRCCVSLNEKRHFPLLDTVGLAQAGTEDGTAGQHGGD